MTKLHSRKVRAHRTRAKISEGKHPRLSVFVSNSHVYAQIIDDAAGQTLVAASDLDIEKKGKNVDIARAVGELVGARAKEKKIKEVIFDRGGKRYHGRVKALAEGARKEIRF